MPDRRAYWETRLAQELERAEQAETDQLRNLHLRWAEMYRQRLRSPGRPLACTGGRSRHDTGT